MITLEQAIDMYTQMIKDSGQNYRIDFVWEIEDDDSKDGCLYIVMLLDEENVQHLPGVFPAIRKSDGALIPWEYGCPS
ncbi:MAG: hypothetical protein IJY28_00520 [Clostridia bacterium]|nr:hypothetical protein [Clostridia bacterium]